MDAQTETVALDGVSAVGVEIRADFNGALNDIARSREHGKALEELVLGHALDGVHHPVRVGGSGGERRGPKVRPSFFEHVVGAFGKTHVSRTRPHRIWPRGSRVKVRVDDGLVAVNAHAPFSETDVRQVFFPSEHPSIVVPLVSLTPAVVADKIDLGTLADFGLHMAQAQGQGVDPHFTFKRELPASPWDKGEVKARARSVVEGVEDVVPIVDVPTVVQGACERAVEKQHLVLVQVDVEELRLHTRGVFAVLHPRGPGRFDALFPSATFGAEGSGDFRDEEGQGHAVLGRVEVVPHPCKWTPKTTRWQFLWVVVEGHFLHFIEVVTKRRNARGVVALLGFGHPLHQGLGRVHRFFVRTDHGRFEVHASGLEGDVDDLWNAALEGNGLALVAEGRIRCPRDPCPARVEHVQAFRVGHGADAGAHKAHVDKGKGFTGFPVKDTSRHRRLGGSNPRPQTQPKGEREAHQRVRRLS